MQYDEALSVRGAVDLTAEAARSITCAAGIDIEIHKRCWPVMVAPYVGAVKDYVAAPLFLVFGIHVLAARMAAALSALSASSDSPSFSAIESTPRPERHSPS